MSKIRIDIYLVEHGFFPTREKAKRAIMAHQVLVNETPVYKAGETFKLENIKDVRIKGNVCPYVSRGGLKLAKAIEVFSIDCNNKTMLDVGSSTGGFTDCALQHGITSVAALDVGTNQLDYKIRNDDRVLVFEQTNFRTIKSDFFNNQFDLITMDVSFISALLLVDNVKMLLKDDGIFICLIKPQFEAGIRAERNHKGVITDPNIHLDVVSKFNESILTKGLYINNIIDSPIKGGNGNREFLAYITKTANNSISTKEIETLIFNKGG